MTGAGGVFLLVPLIGMVAGLALRGATWIGWGIFALLWVVAVVVAVRVSTAVFRAVTVRWPARARQSLVKLTCTGCKRDLDSAPPEFAARHPAPLCRDCRTKVDAGTLQRPVVHPTIEGNR